MKETCFTCGATFEHGENHRYEGRKVQPYNVMVCGICHSGNWDGWAPHLEPKLLERLAELGLPEPERNANGLLPRG